MVGDHSENGAVEVALKLKNGPNHCGHFEFENRIVLLVRLEDPRDEIDRTVALTLGVGACRHGESDIDRGTVFRTVRVNQLRSSRAEVLAEVGFGLPCKFSIRVPHPLDLELGARGSATASGTFAKDVIDLPGVVAVNHGGRGGLQTRPNLSSSTKYCRWRVEITGCALQEGGNSSRAACTHHLQYPERAPLVIPKLMHPTNERPNRVVIQQDENTIASLQGDPLGVVSIVVLLLHGGSTLQEAFE